MESKQNANISEVQNSKLTLLKQRIFNFKFLNKTIFIIILGLGIAYIVDMNSLSTQGFALNDLKEKRNQLAAENEQLELNAMSYSSYKSITKRVNEMKMVAANDVEYVDSSSAMVAKK